jgi:hypothetical protein
MATNFCPACGQPIAPDDINIKEGVALCRSCGALSRLSAIANQPAPNPVASATPPPGCACDEQPGGRLDIRAAHRGVGTTLGMLAVCLFWNGIVSVFVLVALAGVYRHFVGPLPAWFPAPRDASDANRGTGMPWGMTLFLCIFLVPFVAVGAALFLAFLTSLLGRVRVVVDGDEGRVRVGVGPLNWSRRFNAERVTRVATGGSGYLVNGKPRPLIQIEADRTIKFGSFLPDARRAWLLDVLRTQLILQRTARQPGRAAALSRR